MSEAKRLRRLEDENAKLKGLPADAMLDAAALKELLGISGVSEVVPRWLSGGEWRKTRWCRAEAAGDPGQWRQQAVLGRARWDADALRDYALEALADAEAVLVIDETDFLKS